MASTSNIEWTDATWQPITGCSIISPGCTNCYAMRTAGTRLKHHPSRANLTTMTKAGPVWNGAVRFNEQWLTQPLGWKKPRRIFVCAHGDLFHEDVPDEWILDVFTVMAIAGHHTFQVLTKRPERMRDFLNRPDLLGDIYANWTGFSGSPREVYSWPLHNVWLGCSAEDQRRYDQRRFWLDETSAAVKFWSIEPMLGPIDMKIQFAKPNWVIVGGESGPGARPMHPDWGRSIRDQCAAAGVPFFFKQWGAWAPTTGVDVYCHGPDHNRRQYPNSGGVAMLADGRTCLRDFTVADHAKRMRDGIARDARAVEVDRIALADFSESLKDEHRTKDNPLGLQWMYAIGKSAAGRLLDGVTHDAMPMIGGC